MTLNELPETLYLLEGSSFSKDDQEIVLNGTGFSFYYELVGEECYAIFVWSSEDKMKDWQASREYSGFGVNMDRNALIAMLKEEPRIKSVVVDPKPGEHNFASDRIVSIK